MSRRFYDSGLVNQRWYMELSPKHKALYIHCLCVCDCAGILEVNPTMMSAFIGDKIEDTDLFSAFGNRIIPLPDYKALMVDFVYFQCGGELRQGCRPHDAIIKRLREVGMSVEDLQKVCTHELKFTTVNTEPKKVSCAVSIEERKLPRIEPTVKADDTENIVKMFMAFWKEYPRHDSKQSAYKKFTNIMKGKSTEEQNELLSKMIAAIDSQKRSEQWQKDDGKFIPMPTTYLNQARWEDEGVVANDPSLNNQQPSQRIAKTLLDKINLS